MLRPINPKVYTFCLCVAVALLGTLENGFVKVNLLSLERRFGLSTSQLAVILAGYDVAFIVVLIPFTYLVGGPRSDKPRLIAIGFIVIGVGSIILCLPEFLVHQHITKSDTDTNLCSLHEPPSTRMKSSELDHLAVVVILVVGQVLIGIGAIPLYTFAVTWIDENIPKRNSAMYVGFFYTANILGPALGFVVGGFVLDHLSTSFYSPGTSGIKDATDSLWIGAWWILFLGIGLVCIVQGVFLLLYPKNLTRTEPDEMYNIQQEDGTQNSPVLKVLRDLGRNSIYVSLCSVSICEAYILSSFSSFMSKYVENQFGLSTKGSSIIMGCLIVPAGFLGIIAGGYIIKHRRLTTFRLLLFIEFSLILSLLFCAGFILVNEPVKFAGINYPYLQTDESRSDLPHRKAPPYSLESDCNRNCFCDASKYNPVCGVNLVTYFNPCFAGCRSQAVNMNGVKTFHDCACIPTMAANADSMNLENNRRSFSLYRQLFVTSFLKNLEWKERTRHDKSYNLAEKNIVLVAKAIERKIDEMIEDIGKSEEDMKEVSQKDEMEKGSPREVRRSDQNKENDNKNMLDQHKSVEDTLMTDPFELNSTSQLSRTSPVSEVTSTSQGASLFQQNHQTSKKSQTLPLNPPTRSAAAEPTSVITDSQTSPLHSLTRSAAAEPTLVSTDSLTTPLDPLIRSAAAEPTSVYALLISPASKVTEVSGKTSTNFETPTTRMNPTKLSPAVHLSPNLPPNPVRSDVCAYGKACPSTSAHVALFSIGTFFAFFFMFLCIMPATEGILRAVPFQYKSLALALQWFSIRAIAALPSPSLLAVFIDSSCLYWKSGEYCILYDNYYFSRYLTSYAFYFRHLSIYIVLYMMFRVKIDELK